MNGYDLSRNWFNWCFENPEKIKPNHTALYFFCIEHCNRLGWKSKFGLPTTMVKEAIGIKSYNTYINTLNDLVDWGFVEMIERSKNQYSSNIIALSNFNKALDKALDKALIKHTTKQSESTRQSIDSIDKQLTSKQKNNKQIPAYEDFKNYALDKCSELNFNVSENQINAKYQSWIANDWRNGNGKQIKNWKSTILNTLPYLNNKESVEKTETEADREAREFMENLNAYNTHKTLYGEASANEKFKMIE